MAASTSLLASVSGFSRLQRHSSWEMDDSLQLACSLAVKSAPSKGMLSCTPKLHQAQAAGAGLILLAAAPGHERGKHGGRGHFQALGPHHLLRHNIGASRTINWQPKQHIAHPSCPKRCTH